VDATQPSFLERHDFLIRRLHSLSGLIPVGAYMVIHLLTNATVLNSPGSYQASVYGIHSLGILLPVVEWTFIFIPILFHGIVGVWIVMEGLPNTRSYPYASTVRYYLQRMTGVIAFIFIFYHVFHMHGWFHFEWWHENITEPFGGAQFKPYSATSTTAAALQNGLVTAAYFVGIAASVFHLANGIWTMGITWGVWTTPAAMRRANWVCGGLGILVLFVGLSALFGMRDYAAGEDREEAVEIENKMYKAKVEAGLIEPEPGKRAVETAETATAASAGTAGNAAAETGSQPSE